MTPVFKIYYNNSHKTVLNGFIEIFEFAIRRAELGNNGEIYLAFAFIQSSGLNYLRDVMDKFLQLKGKINIIVGLDILGTEPQALKDLLQYSKLKNNLEVKVVSNNLGIFHPKLIIYHDLDANNGCFLLGSANISETAFLKNQEIMLFGRDESTVNELMQIFTRWWENAIFLSNDIIKKYIEKYNQYKESEMVNLFFENIQASLTDLEPQKEKTIISFSNYELKRQLLDLIERIASVEEPFNNDKLAYWRDANLEDFLIIIENNKKGKIDKILIERLIINNLLTYRSIKSVGATLNYLLFLKHCKLIEEETGRITSIAEKILTSDKEKRKNQLKWVILIFGRFLNFLLFLDDALNYIYKDPELKMEGLSLKSLRNKIITAIEDKKIDFKKYRITFNYKETIKRYVFVALEKLEMSMFLMPDRKGIDLQSISNFIFDKKNWVITSETTEIIEILLNYV